MDWQFGYNCAHLLPKLDKCRIMIERYNRRDDLLATRVLTTWKVLAYTGWSAQELMDRVESGDLDAYKVKKPLHPAEDGFVRYRLKCAWDWDTCGMARDSGGICEWYEPIDGPHITCLAEVRPEVAAMHPNMVLIPSDEDWHQVDEAIRGMVPEKTAREAKEDEDAVSAEA